MLAKAADLRAAANWQPPGSSRISVSPAIETPLLYPAALIPSSLPVRVPLRWIDFCCVREDADDGFRRARRYRHFEERLFEILPRTGGGTIRRRGYAEVLSDSRRRREGRAAAKR